MAFNNNSPVGTAQSKKRYAQGPNYTNASFSVKPAPKQEGLVSKIRYDLGTAIGLHRKTAANAANGGGPQKRFANGPVPAASSGPTKRYANRPKMTPDTQDHSLSANSPVPVNNSPVGGAQATKRTAMTGLPDKMMAPDTRYHNLSANSPAKPTRSASPNSASAPSGPKQGLMGRLLGIGQPKLSTADFLEKINRSK